MKKAEGWFKQAANRGHAEAKAKLDQYFPATPAPGRPQGNTIADPEQAAREGNSEAQSRLADRHLSNDSAAEREQAVPPLKKSADKGYTGSGVYKSLEKDSERDKKQADDKAEKLKLKRDCSTEIIGIIAALVLAFSFSKLPASAAMLLRSCVSFVGSILFFVLTFAFSCLFFGLLFSTKSDDRMSLGLTIGFIASIAMILLRGVRPFCLIVSLVIIGGIVLFVVSIVQKKKIKESDIKNE